MLGKKQKQGLALTNSLTLVAKPEYASSSYKPGSTLVGSHERGPKTDEDLRDTVVAPLFGRTDDGPPGETEIREELSRILSSKTFSRAVQMSGLLSWITGRWLAGEADQLDSYRILLAVLHRSKPAEAESDSTGRVYVGRLRRQLERYYNSEGCENLIRIEIPTGSYVPVARRPWAPVVQLPDKPLPGTVLVLPFHYWHQSPASPIAPLMTDHLILLLTRIPNIQVISRVASANLVSELAAPELGRQLGVQFIVAGSVHQSGELYDLIVHLSATCNGHNIWSGRYQATSESWTELATQIARALTREMRRAAAQTV